MVEVPFIDAEESEFALFWIGIEAIGHEMPLAKEAKVQIGIEPVAEAYDGGADKSNGLGGLVEHLARCVVADEIAREFVFDGEREGGVQDVVGERIIAIAELHEV